MPVPRNRMHLTLRRYCDLAVAMHVLQTQTLTLIDPAKWDDGNDRYSMAAFKERRQLKSLLAMCFANCGETYHHWRIFTEGKSGVCIEIHKAALRTKVETLEGFEIRNVDYRRIIRPVVNPRWDVSDLPFIKRAPYEPEREMRVIYSSADEEVTFKPIPIQLSWIKRIVLSPWMPKALQDAVISTLKGIDGCSHLDVVPTTLIDNDTWKRFVDGAAS